jgi:hypothetical protein
MKHLRGDGSLPLETFRGEAPVGAVEPGQLRTLPLFLHEL